MLYALPRPNRPGEQLLEIPVIVGRTLDRTPIFSASIEEVVFNPYWDVPASILRDELLPKIRKNAWRVVPEGGSAAMASARNSAWPS